MGRIESKMSLKQILFFLLPLSLVAGQNEIDVSTSYVNDLLGNPIGGERPGFANAGSWGINLSLDLEKASQLRGMSLFTSVVYRSGSNLSAKCIGNQFPVAQEYGGETYRLNELYLKQTLPGSTLKAGRLNGGNDFLASPIYQHFVSNAFDGNPIGIFFNVPFTAYPFATWGAYAAFKISPSLLLKFATYNNNLEALRNKYHGTDFTFKHPEGLFYITEWVYSPNSGGLPGNYKLGYYYVTGETALFEGGKQKGNYGYYLLVDQMLTRHGPSQGLTPFGAFLWAPKDRNQFPFFLATGFLYQGTAASRPKDAIAFGVAYGAYSEDLRKVQKQAKAQGLLGPHGNRPQTAETLLELNYWAQLTQWLVIVPDIQYIINPKGYGTIKNALVLGMQVGIYL